MQVVHVYKDYYPPVYGGVEITINALAHGVKEAGWDPIILVANRCFRTSRMEVEGIPVIKVADLGRVWSAPMTPTFPRWLKRTRGDILHFHLPNPTAVLSYLRVRPPGRLVVHYHSDIVRQASMARYYQPMLDSFLERANAIIATSPRYLESSEVLQRHKERCHVIPLAVEPHFMSPDPEVLHQAEVIRERYGDRPLVLFVGVLRYYKGLSYLIRAMKGLKANLLVVGNGPLFRKMVQIRDELGLRKNVFFMGHVSDVRPYFYAADCFCLPSIERSEAFGIVLLEAMAASLPLVTTDLETGVCFVNRDGETGLVVPRRNAESLHEALKQLLFDPERREKMGRAGRERLEANFTREIMIQRILDLYRQILVDAPTGTQG
jgi:rhamnosyl/mannosyltransferase